MSPKLSIALLLAASVPLQGEDLDFYQDIFPALKANCIACHNKTTTKGGLNMETPEAMLKGGNAGPSMIPKKGQESLVILASRHLDDMEMPPANNKSGAVNLTDEEIAAFSKWIDQGAKSSKQVVTAVKFRQLSASVQPIYTIALSADGRYAACGRSNRIYLYDLAARILIGELGDPALADHAAHRAVVQSLSFSPDGKYLASGSYREVKLWDLQARKKIPTAEPKPVPEPLALELEKLAKTKLQASAISADAKLAVLAGADGSIQVWDAIKKSPIVQTKTRIEPSQGLLKSERNLGKLNLDLAFYQASVAKVEAEEKALDELLKKAKETVVAMTKELPTKQQALVPAKAATEKAQKGVDAAKSALTDSNDPAKVKALKDAQEKLITAQTAETSALSALQNAESNIADANADQKSINSKKGQNKTGLEGLKETIEKVKKAQTEENQKIAALKKAPVSSAFKSIALSLDGAYVVAQTAEGTSLAWAVSTGEALDSDQVIQGKLAKTLGGEESPDLFADRLNALAFRPDGKVLATGGGELSRSGDIHQFEVASGKMLHAWKDLHEDSIFSLNFSPNGKTLITGSADKIAKGFDASTGKQTHLFEGHTNYVNGVAYRADGRVIATASADGTVMTWDAESGERIRKIQGWVKEITSISFVDHSSQILTSSGENMVRVVNESGGQVRAITGLSEFMQTAIATPGGKFFVGGGEDSVMRVWEASTGKEVATFDPPSKS